ncbi:alpha/beta-hydrolase [Wolfiporia cocos MD-104 SS10]|uniref:Alpha/beta-hydrolase n=1 Tax=Wolfiporia cocos (strain MD-104) TaxID=742152 RepID=A0A2H3JCS5_WOLCO|nr:alpha/beta-hydrolase [Wolfiporia cocos MD-104 SS10]
MAWQSILCRVSSPCLFGRSFLHRYSRCPNGPDPAKVAASAEAEKVGFVWVPPLSTEYIVGEVRDIAQLNGVEAKKTFGYWTKDGWRLHYGLSQPPRRFDRTNLWWPTFPLSACLAHLLLRLSSSPFPNANPFPAALFDALAGYHYLIHTIGVSARNIVVSGDSAGGHLAISLVRYLATNQIPGLPVPGALLLLSPTTEWVVTHDGPDSSFRKNASTDYCADLFRGYTKRSLLGKLPPEAAYTNAWISPASLELSDVSGMFKGFPKTYIAAGDAEILFDAMRTFGKRLAEDIGEDMVTFDAVRDGTHDCLALELHEPQRTDTLKRIASWLEQ